MRKLYFFLAALIVMITLAVLYGQSAIFRYPGLTLDPEPLPTRMQLVPGLQLTLEGAYQQSPSESRFRAYKPQVSMLLRTEIQTEPVRLYLENVHPEANLSTGGMEGVEIEEHTDGLLRELRLPALEPGARLNLVWEFPQKEAYRFIALGDTGGDRELDWALIRAGELDADFVLHLGDVYYYPGELGGVGERMNQGPVPVYTASGNHDFRGPEGNSFDLFMRNIGPHNARFELLGRCFINLDTGAYMYPPHKGQRASMLAAEWINRQHNPQQCSEYVVFTHKPLVYAFEVDFPKQDHALEGYDAWSLVRQLQQLGQVTILAGHIHADFEFEQDGFKTYVAGGGLAHADLLQGSFAARILVGTVRADQPVQFEWVLNLMPTEYHCSQKVHRELERSQNPLLQRLQEACAPYR